MSVQTHAPLHEGEQEHDHDDTHVLPLSTYIGVWVALVVLTAITVGVSRFDFGTWNTVVALLIATIKGSLVALFFMHLRYDNKFNMVALLSGLLFLGIFIIPTLIDVTTRGAIDPLRNQGPAPTGFVDRPPPAPGAAHE
jgi:cytochrome c oxidase subunit 4